MDYADVATTVFTPLEYGSVGMSEETARAKFGSENVRVFYGGFKPTTWNFNAERNPRACYGKLIVHKQTDQVVGLHYCGPDAAEVTQGYGVAIKMRATKKDFDNTVGIHPSASEVPQSHHQIGNGPDDSDEARAVNNCINKYHIVKCIQQTVTH
jgi:thioredoxin reductase (NADPH)